MEAGIVYILALQHASSLFIAFYKISCALSGPERRSTSPGIRHARRIPIGDGEARSPAFPTVSGVASLVLASLRPGRPFPLRRRSIASCRMPPPTQPPSSPDDPEPPVAREMDDEDLVEELLVTVNSARAFAEFRRTQRKECANLLRWLQLVLPLLEELRDAAPRLTDDAYRRLALLGRALAAARRLLRSCNDGSKIYLALECETVLAKFRNVYEKMHSALDGMPYDELAISDEVKEQVELMNAQLMRCKKRTDTQDMELSMDIMVILQNNEDERNADRAILERLAKKLELQTLAELRAETKAIKKIINERNGQQADSTKQIIDLLNRFKEIAGIDEKNVLGDVSMPKSLDKCPSLMIPNDFLCPITLEIMTDPVIVASGQVLSHPDDSSLFCEMPMLQFQQIGEEFKSEHLEFADVRKKKHSEVAGQRRADVPKVTAAVGPSLVGAKLRFEELDPAVVREEHGGAAEEGAGARRRRAGRQAEGGHPVAGGRPVVHPPRRAAEGGEEDPDALEGEPREPAAHRRRRRHPRPHRPACLPGQEGAGEHGDLASEPVHRRQEQAPHHQGRRHPAHHRDPPERHPGGAGELGGDAVQPVHARREQGGDREPGRARAAGGAPPKRDSAGEEGRRHGHLQPGAHPAEQGPGHARRRRAGAARGDRRQGARDGGRGAVHLPAAVVARSVPRRDRDDGVRGEAGAADQGRDAQEQGVRAVRAAGAGHQQQGAAGARAQVRPARGPLQDLQERHEQGAEEGQLAHSAGAQVVRRAMYL